MRNIYRTIGLILFAVNLVLAGFAYYIYQSGEKKIAKSEEAHKQAIAELETKYAFKPMSEISLEKIMQEIEASGQRESGVLSADMEKMLASLDKETRYCGTEGDFFKAYLGEAVRSLSLEGEQARVASFKAAAASSVPAVIICIDDKKFVNVPEANKAVCEGMGNWPDFNNLYGARWGGCDFQIDKKKETFEYCAVYGDTKAVCNQGGCNFVNN
ncbi:MAG: hypothetical protein V3574_05665 [Candidatus Moraniibacteriota bacterium]